MLSRKKIISTSVLFFYLCLVLNAQESLPSLIKQTQQNSYYDSASVFSVGNKAIALARKQKNYPAENEILIYYGNFYYYSQKFDIAKKYYDQAFNLAIKSGS